VLGFTEKGDNPFRLAVASSDETYFALRPAVEIGAQFEPRTGLRVRPHLALDATRPLGGAEPSAEAAFAGNPGGVAGFETRTGLDDIQHKLTAGLEVLSNSGMAIELEAFTSSSDSTSGNGASLEVRVPFSR
jgi:hypothetical protein